MINYLRIGATSSFLFLSRSMPVCLILLLLIFQASAFEVKGNLLLQQAKFTGTVKDAKGTPIVGASVSVKGTKVGTSTDTDGRFAISLPAGGHLILVINHLGHVTREIPLSAGQSSIQVTLQDSEKALDEVVVIGYGEVKKRDLTGSVVSVKGEDLTKVPVTSPAEALQGRVPGADITRNNGYAGQRASIQLRGNRSIANPESSNNVLYIVDGIQGVAAQDVDPNDIQSIEVLKDASSTAIYGSRGANGVILITTKRGANEKPRLNYNAYAGVSKVAGYGEFMTGQEYVDFRREAYRAVGTWNSPADDNKILNPLQLQAFQNGQFTNWSDLLLHNGFQQNHQLSVSGGGKNTKVYFSGAYFQEKGLLKMDEYRRYSGRLNIDQTINSWMNVGLQSQFAYIDNDIRRDPLNQASKIAPLGLPYDENGEFNLFPLQGTLINPLADEQPDAYKRNTKSNRATVSGYIELKPIKDLSIKSTFGAIFSTSEAGNFYSKNTIDGKGSRSQASITNNQDRNISWENVITYNKRFADHSLQLTGVTSYLSWTNTNSYAGGNNQLFPSQYYYNIGGANQNPFYGSGYVESKLLSFSGRINYSYKGKYLLTLTGRNDGSSKLAAGHKWAFFPSAAAAWRIVDEDFMKNQQVFSDLKLRVSYGVSGNDVISPYATQNSVVVQNFSFNDANAANAYVINGLIGNNTLKWELTKTMNIGVDFGLFNNIVTGSVDYYHAKTDDLIFPYTLPLSTGVTTVNRNIGKTQNKGIELSLTSHNIQKNSFSWNTNLTFARNNEKIVALPNGNVIADDYRESLIVGQPAQIYYDYKKIGIWQLGEEEQAAQYGAEPGDIKIADLNNDGKIDAFDRTIIGQRVPKWTAGLSNDLRFKGFDLNILLVARVGQWISSDYYAKYKRNGLENGARIDYWTPENPTNEYPRPNANKNSNYVTTLTERQASYVKIRNITLGYNFPSALISKWKLQSLRIYASGKNLHTFSSLKDFDPEGEGVIDQPLNRLFVFGLNVGF
ncbi:MULTISPECIES: SusC/RagA family TonB-linked outer membrane protein [Olivibacter]|uniref:SusC/RagA family TonB-linked outer membrane protein n=1 Tax=Olivibacter jilunii TaxID=985016 RepID=A0ABW6B1I0_9SPHI